MGTLRAVRFDLFKLEVQGDPVTVLDDVMTKATGGANYSVSAPGTIVYMPGAAGEAPVRSLVWVDRKGHEEPIKVVTQLPSYPVTTVNPAGRAPRGWFPQNT